MSKPLNIFLFTFCFLTGFAQTKDKYTLRFVPVWGNTPVVLNDSTYRLQNDGKIRISSFRFYVSGIRLTEHGKDVFQEPNSFHLVDASDPASLYLALDLPTGLHYDHLNFNLGIDSLTNVGGAMGGVLDPSKGMYWAWHSGYINTKLEGNCNRCPSPEKEFQFHLGGYQSPFNVLQSLELSVKPSDSISLQIDLARFFNNTRLQERDHIMSPGEAASRLSILFHDCFHLEENP